MSAYVVKGYIGGKCCLSAAYKRKGTAQNAWKKRVDSGCYDKVVIAMQNAVYFDETSLILRTWNGGGEK